MSPRKTTIDYTVKQCIALLIFLLWGDFLKTEKNYLSSAFLLLITSVVIKITGALYKIPLTAYIGAVGRGYFATAYNLYLPLHAVIMGAMPIALSRLVSKYNAKNDLKMISSLRKGAAFLFACAGALGTLILFLCAKPYSVYIASSPESVYTVYTLAPSIFLCCAAAMYRGYYEGYLDMKPTSVSQLIEALFKAVIGLVLARLCVYFMTSHYNSKDNLIYPYSSAAAMFGATLGSLFSLLYVFIYDKRNNIKLPKASVRQGRAELISFSLPILISCSVQSVFQFLDTATIQYSLNCVSPQALSATYKQALELSKTSASDAVNYVWGLFSASLDFKNLIPGITMALGVCAVPAICREFENNNNERTQNLINTILSFTSFLSVFLGFVIALNSNEILTLFYGKSSYDVVAGCRETVVLFSLTAPVYSLASVAVYSVQALGKPDKTIIPYVISGIIRCVLNIALVRDERFILTGAVISGAVSYAVMFFINLYTVKRISKTKISLKNTVFKALFSGIAAYFFVIFGQEFIFFSKNFIVNLLMKTTLFATLYYILCIFLKVFNLREIFCVLKNKKNGLNT